MDQLRSGDAGVSFRRVTSSGNRLGLADNEEETSAGMALNTTDGTFGLSVFQLMIKW